MGLLDGVLSGILGKKENKRITAPENDTEKWITITYGMWSAWAWTDGDWRYFAGIKESNKQKESSLRVVLRRDWGITDKASLYDMVKNLTDLYGIEADREKLSDIGAWDLCRACQILGMGYVAGHIEKEEMVTKSVEVGRIMQQYYHSWKELYDSYMKGYSNWRKSQGGNAQEDIAERETIYSDIWKHPEGPSSIKWDLKL